jgi:type IV secretory pathway VirD2 relaxase
LQTEQEVALKREAEITAERFTDIDRSLVADMTAARTIDMRPGAGQVSADQETTLRQGRVRTLERMDLAEQVSPGVWRISEDLEPTLRGLGERGDIIRAMSRAVSRRGREANPEFFVIDPANEPSTPKAGRVIDKRLTDELGDRVGLVVDGIDGHMDFPPAPWRPVMERYRGQDIAGTVERGGNISWQLGRGRGLGI